MIVLFACFFVFFEAGEMQTLFHVNETEQNSGRNGHKDAGNGQRMCFRFLVCMEDVLCEEYSTHFGWVYWVADSTRVRM